jgi:hypothetical protein
MVTPASPPDCQRDDRKQQKKSYDIILFLQLKSCIFSDNTVHYYSINHSRMTR